ncbi:MAG: DUF58 domain-containing protein, partial [Candidatus Eremiobacteraeota bacterium]|nr:DUF58 domain-containing protein [Candidatus Eremiobacteraeota bacterium]
MRPAMWLSRRGVWVLLILCALLALSSIVPLALVLVALTALAATVTVIADLRIGPSGEQLRLQRSHGPYAALDRADALDYTFENRCGSSLHIELAEAPVERVAFEDATSLVAPAHSVLTFTNRFVAYERGPARFSAVYARVRNDVGMLERRFFSCAPLEIHVYPDFSAVEGYGTLARRSTLLETGLRKLRLRGAGTEFESLREYAAGDAFRTIDWKATARRGRLMVAQYDVERSQNLLIGLDAGRLMTPRIGRRRKFDYALSAGLSVARVAQIAGDNVGLVAFAGRTLREVPPHRGLSHHAALVRAVYDLQPRMEEPDYEAFAAHVRRRYAKRSLVVIFTDLFDPAASQAILGSIAVLSGRHLVMCIFMNDASISDAVS